MGAFSTVLPWHASPAPAYVPRNLTPPSDFFSRRKGISRALVVAGVLLVAGVVSGGVLLSTFRGRGSSIKQTTMTDLDADGKAREHVGASSPLLNDLWMSWPPASAHADDDPRFPAPWDKPDPPRPPKSSGGGSVSP
jgi:hypothetical protein